MKRPSKGQERTVPTQERARDTVHLLLEATEQVARRIGFDEATTKEIASVAGVSAGTLYRYFPSKEALLPRFSAGSGRSDFRSSDRPSR